MPSAGFDSGSSRPDLHGVDDDDTDGAGAGAAASKQRYIGNYELGRTIGEGAFAKVRLGTHRLTNQKVAVKIIDKEKLPDAYAVKHMHREALIMKLLDHPNIVQLYEVIETKKEIYLVMELAEGGELLDFIVSNGRIKEEDAKYLTRQIVDALVNEPILFFRVYTCKSLP
jgi:MAP/microtubule affinity-regulating kinase